MHAEIHQLQFKVERAIYKFAIRIAKSRCWNDLLENIEPSKRSQHMSTQIKQQRLLSLHPQGYWTLTNNLEELVQTFLNTY